ncbi:DUF3487 family protein [Endothiovibrio diazotrophicus]
MVASDLDQAPPALLGLTAEELPRVVGVALTGWFLLSLLAALLTGIPFLVVLFPLLGTVATVHAAGRAARELKRGRPLGWLIQHLYTLRARWLGLPVPWVHRAGVYEIR